MIIPGLVYDIEIPTFTRSLTVDEVICRISAPSDSILLVLEMWFNIVGTDGLNEPNTMEIVRLSSDGTGGSTALFEPREGNSPAFPGTGAGIDAGDWSADPTVSDVLGGGRGFNLATGWVWSWTESGVITVSPSARIGFRIVDALSASMICHAGMTVSLSGG